MRPKSVLITGAGQRVGAGIAKSLARSGYRVGLAYNRSAQGAKAVQAELLSDGIRVELFQADLTQTTAREALLDAAVEIFDGLDGLINCASLFTYDDIDSLNETNFDVHMAINFTAPLFLAQGLHARRREGKKACVINILDQKIDNPNPDFLSYTAGKLALGAMTQTLALAMAPHTRLVGLSPGLVLPSGDQTQADYERAAKATPLNVTCSIEDLTRACDFILMTQSLTGQIITVDGGESLTGRPRDVAFDLKS
jgi:NAD(P)-dependent dehydrogenase (short-subunit alcohol dehydrogenase family)